MPGRKSNISTASVGPEDGAESTPVRSIKEGKEGMGVEVCKLNPIGQQGTKNAI